jgi:hypothetical protein
VCVACAQDVFDEWSHWPSRDANATSRRRCVVTVHDKAVVGSRRGTGSTMTGQARREAHAARSGGGPTHARAPSVPGLRVSVARAGRQRSGLATRHGGVRQVEITVAGLGRARLSLVAWVRTHARGSWYPMTAAWLCRAWGAGARDPWHGAAARGRWRLQEAWRHPGSPGPRHGCAVCGALGLRVRGTVQRREDDGGCRKHGGAWAPA